MEDNSYDANILKEILNRKPWRPMTSEEKRIYDLHWKYCPDGKPHEYEVVPGESYMCFTVYKCKNCDQKMAQDSSD